MKRFFVSCILLFSSGSLAQNAHLNVVATFSVLGDFVQNVAGEDAELHVLVGPDADTHTYEPSPADVATIGEADIIFEDGLGFETWLDDLVTSSQSNATRVVTSHGIEPLPASEIEESEEEQEGEAHEEHDHGEFDPHVWHDVQNAIVMVENIRAALVSAVPANAETYNGNAEAYTAELEKLDSYIESRVASLPEDRRKLVTSHDTFGYFARHYGFEIVGAVIPSVSTEGADPAAGELAALTDRIRSAGVPAIFTENVTNPALLEQVASAADVRVAPPLYTDALGEPGSAGYTYLKMERYNIDTIIKALSE